MSRCIRCSKERGTVLVHVIAAGSVYTGPSNARIYACDADARAIFKQLGTPPWMPQKAPS